MTVDYSALPTAWIPQLLSVYRGLASHSDGHLVFTEPMAYPSRTLAEDNLSEMEAIRGVQGHLGAGVFSIVLIFRLALIQSKTTTITMTMQSLQRPLQSCMTGFGDKALYILRRSSSQDDLLLGKKEPSTASSHHHSSMRQSRWTTIT